MKRFIAIAALAFVALPAAASAQQQSPTDARIKQRQQAEVARKQREYQRCASFSNRVFAACLQQAGNNSPAIRSCRRNLARNLQGCQQILR